MVIQDAFAVAGRGMVVTGWLNGKVVTGDPAVIKNENGEILKTTQVCGIEHDHRLWNSMEGGPSQPRGVGLLLQNGLSRNRDWYIGKTIAYQ